jgi:hypothetical protein
MKIELITVALLSLATLGFVRPVQAQPRPRQIAPSVSVGGGRSVFGVDSRFPVTQNLSIRPNIRFPSGGVVLGTSATYDFDAYGDSRLEPYVGAGFNLYTGDNSNNGANLSGYAIGGVDYSLNNQLTLKGSLIIPFKSEYSTDVILGVGYKF